MADKPPFNPLAGATTSDMEAIRRGQKRGWNHLASEVEKRMDAEPFRRKAFEGMSDDEYERSYKKFTNIMEDSDAYQSKRDNYPSMSKGGMVNKFAQGGKVLNTKSWRK